MSLVCIKPLLIGNRQYQPGDVLPFLGETYTETLKRNGVIKEEETKDAPAKAKVLAEPGLVGKAEPKTGTEPELVGKPPKREARTTAKPTTKRGTKRSE